jgi:hypothetical protein
VPRPERLAGGAYRDGEDQDQEERKVSSHLGIVLARGSFGRSLLPYVETTYTFGGVPLDVSQLVAQLQASGFQDVAGTRLSARVPVSGALLNQIIADALRGTSAPVRSVRVRPLAGERFEAVVTTSMPFVPPLTVHVAVDQQPRFPASPFLVLRWSFLGGLGAIASRFVGALEGRLPPGIRLDGDRIVIDIAAIVRRSGRADVVDLVRYLTLLEIHTVDDRAVIEVELAVP